MKTPGIPYIPRILPGLYLQQEVVAEGATRNVPTFSRFLKVAALSEERALKSYLCVSLEARRRTVGNVQVLPYGEFLDELWDGRYS